MKLTCQHFSKFLFCSYSSLIIRSYHSQEVRRLKGVKNKYQQEKNKHIRMLVKYLSLLFLINTVTSQCRSGRCRRPSRVNFQTSSTSSSRSSSTGRFRFSSGSQGLCSGNCGRSRQRIGCDTKITGGKEACENEFPWAALLEIDGISRCGGNLINDR